MASGSNLRTVVLTAARKHLEILELLGASNATSNEVSESSKIVVSTIILMIWIIGITSNVVIWIRACSPRCQGLFGQRALSVYVVHKSIADFMFLLSCPFPHRCLVHPKGWLFGPVGCRFIASVDMLAILLSGNALFSLGIERYTSVVRASMSVSHRLKRLRRSYLHVAAIWVYCVILASPVIAVSTSYTGSMAASSAVISGLRVTRTFTRCSSASSSFSNSSSCSVPWSICGITPGGLPRIIRAFTNSSPGDAICGNTAPSSYCVSRTSSVGFRSGYGTSCERRVARCTKSY